MLNLDDRSLMALEFGKSIIESNWFFNETTRKMGLSSCAESIMREAVALADALKDQLQKQAQGSVTLINENGESVPVKLEVVEEAKRLAIDGKVTEAVKLVKGDTGCTQKAAKEFVEKLVPTIEVVAK